MRIGQGFVLSACDGHASAGPVRWCMTATPSLIALDWGTSSLRALLLDGAGNVIESRTEPWGLMHLPGGDFGASFHAVTTPWCAHTPGLPAIAAGMVGSAQGWVHAPYCPAPAGAEELAKAMMRVPGVDLSVVPGISTCAERPDVMRGEETQVVGALEAHPALAADSLVILPGTHSKWVRVTEGRVGDFTTYITGELFAVLRDHSILGRFAIGADGASDRSAMDDAFARGVRAAHASGKGLAPLLFSARSLVLAHQLPADASLEYLSGLLIGDEMRCGLAGGRRPAALIGDPRLCGRYVAALQLVGIDDIPVIGGAAERGLWSIALRAGLVARAS